MVFWTSSRNLCVKGSFVAELLLQREVRVRFQVAEGKIFEFALDDGTYRGGER